MAAGQVADRQAETARHMQEKRNVPQRSLSSSIRQPQNASHTSTSGSSRSAVHFAPSSLHHSKERSSSLGGQRLHASTLPVASRPFDVANRRFCQPTASSTNRMAANDVFAHQNLSRSKPQLDQRSRPTARSLHPVSSKGSLASTDRTLPAYSRRVPLSSSTANREQAAAAQTVADAAPSHNHHEQAKSLSSKSKTSDKSKHRVAGKSDGKGPATSLQRNAEQLCKECRTRAITPVCFINNDGKVAAALLPRIHHCKKPGCAANLNNSHSSDITSRKPPIVRRHSLRMAVPQPAKFVLGSSSKNKPGLFGKLDATTGSSTSSSRGGDADGKSNDASQMNEARIKVRSADGEGLQASTDMNSHPMISVVLNHQSEANDASAFEDNAALAHIENSQYPTLSENEENYADSRYQPVESGRQASRSSASSDSFHPREGNDDKHTKDNATDELHDFKVYCYQGDNEYSCSEDGTDATTTPRSLSKGVFDHPSTLDAEEHLKSTAQHSMAPSTAKMWQKYLASLKEQEAETVRLRKQEMMARKQAGDWMLDCHMGELLHKLAPQGDARVRTLVEAFETVIHNSDSECSETNHREHTQMHGGHQELQHDNMHSDITV